MSAFAMCGTIPSSVHQFHVACLFHSLHGKHGSSLVTDFCWYALYAHYPHDHPSVEGLQKDCYVENPPILPGANEYPPDMGPSLVGADLTLPSSMLNRNLPQNRSSSFHRRRQLLGQILAWTLNKIGF